MATWAASILTGVSVLLALLLFARERRKDDMKQASEFIVWAETSFKALPTYEPPYYYHVIAKNLSDYPIFTPVILFIPLSRRKLEYNNRLTHRILVDAEQKNPKLKETFDRPKYVYLAEPRDKAANSVGTRTFVPHSEREQSIQLRMPPSAYEIHLTFSDSNNRRWERDPTTGELKKYHAGPRIMLFMQNLRLRRFLRYHHIAWLLGERTK